MASGMFTFARTALVLLLLLIQLIQWSRSMSPTLTVVENQPANVTITIPDTTEIYNMGLITIAIDHHDNGTKSYVIYIYTRSLEYKVHGSIKWRLVVSREPPSGRTFRLTFAAADEFIAGTFRCFHGTTLARNTIIDDCGQLVVVLRPRSMSPSLTVVENQPVNVTITVPDNTEIHNNTARLTIAIDHHDNGDQQDVVYIYTKSLEYKVAPDFNSRMVVTRRGRTFQLTFATATADIAGTFRCHSVTSTVKIEDCGQLLVVLRKPPKPTIVPFNATVDLVELHCLGTHGSLPPLNFGSEITWQYTPGTFITSTGEGILLLNIQQIDSRTKFTCSFADRLRLIGPTSDLSDTYYVGGRRIGPT